jgi:hypothetical protein
MTNGHCRKEVNFPGFVNDGIHKDHVAEDQHDKRRQEEKVEKAIDKKVAQPREKALHEPKGSPEQEIRPRPVPRRERRHNGDFETGVPPQRLEGMADDPQLVQGNRCYLTHAVPSLSPLADVKKDASLAFWPHKS